VVQGPHFTRPDWNYADRGQSNHIAELDDNFYQHIFTNSEKNASLPFHPPADVSPNLDDIPCCKCFFKLNLQAFNLYWIFTGLTQLTLINVFRSERMKNFMGVPDYLPDTELERLN